MKDIYLDIEIANDVTKEQLDDINGNISFFKPSVIVCLSNEDNRIFIPDECLQTLYPDGSILAFEDKNKICLYPFSSFCKWIENFEEQIRIVGHNVKKFDWPILKNSFMLESKPLFLDTLKDLKEKTGDFISLNNLCKRTLNEGKSEDGALAPKMWRDGEYWRVIEYCLKDVVLHKRLVEYSKINGFVKYYKWSDNPYARGIKEVKVNWE